MKLSYRKISIQVSVYLPHYLIHEKSTKYGSKDSKFDIDGILADNSHILPYIDTDEQDWDSFYSLMEFDDLILVNLKILLDYFESGHEIYLFTSQPFEYHDITEKWLLWNNIPYGTLLMRRTGDIRPAEEVKRDFLTELSDEELK